MADITWSKTVDAPHYAAAYNYLSLKYSPEVAKTLVQQLKGAKLTTRPARDILRASKLKPLRKKDSGVQREAEKVEQGKPLQPVLVLSLPIGADIADGYHRISLAYLDSDETPVPCKIITPDALYG